MTTARILFSIAGGLLVLLGAYWIVQSEEVAEWPITLGSLDYALLQNASSPTTGGASDWGANVGRVRYHYEVRGVSYSGYRVVPLQSVYLTADAVTNLEPGPVNVYYDPGDPSSSYLDNSAPWVQIRMLFLGGGLALLMALLLPRVLSLFLGVASVGT